MLSISKTIVCGVSYRLLFLICVSFRLQWSFLFQEGKLLSVDNLQLQRIAVDNSRQRGCFLVTCQTALFVVHWEYIPRAILTGYTCAPNLIWVKALFVEPFSLLSPAQSIVLALLSQLPPAHTPQFGDDFPRKNQRMQTGIPIINIHVFL